MITNHDFIRDRDGRCGYAWGSGAERERCGNSEDYHAAPGLDRTASGIDKRPHSRACTSRPHDHGWTCSENCPTCHGREVQEPDPTKTHESTKRVLFHIVNCYQKWRTGEGRSLGVPNEFTDDAIRIGEQHLRLVDWFPEDEGWMANTDVSPDGKKVPKDSVLALIDAELDRLRNSRLEDVPLDRWRNYKRGWVQGVHDARTVSIDILQKIRDAYVVESLTRETESLRLYDIEREDDGR